MYPKFKVGDIVKLKSGGPNMTISAIKNDPDSSNLNGKIIMTSGFFGNYECKWFENQGDSQISRTSIFNEDTLELI